MAQQTNDDAWDWDINQVVSYFYQPHLRLNERIRNMPDLRKFEADLRDQAVDGACLLRDVDAKVLQTEFHINKLGQRSSIMYCVQKLRNESDKYKEYAAQCLTVDETIEDQALQNPTQREQVPVEIPEARISESGNRDLSKVSMIPSSVVKQSDSKIEHDGGERKRRRVTLIQQSTIEQTFPGTVFLGKKGIPLSGVVAPVFARDETRISFPETFAQSQWLPPGQRTFVYKRIRHFLQQKPQMKEHNTVATYQHPEHLIVSDEQRYAMVLKTDGSNVFVSKDIPQTQHRTYADDTNSHTQTGKARSSAMDEVLPVYGDSGSEGDYDSDILAEMEEEKSTNDKLLREASRTIMEAENVDNFVQAFISKIVEKWKADKLPLLKNKAYKFWKRHQGRVRANAITRMQSELFHFDGRVARLCQEIADGVWFDDDELKKQCRCLQPSVVSQQGALWRLQVLESKQPPPKILEPLQTSREISSKSSDEIDDDEDGEDIESELDAFDEIESQTDGEEKHDIELNRNNQDDRNNQNATSTKTAQTEQPSELPTEDARYIPIDRFPEVIDLTLESSDEMEMGTESRFNCDPSVASAAEILNWSWNELEERQDRKRIVMKVLYEMMPLKDALAMQDLIRGTNVDLAQDLKKGLTALLHYDGGEDLQIPAIAMRQAKLYLCWVFSNHAHWEDHVPHDITNVLGTEIECEPYHDFVISLDLANRSEDTDESDEIDYKVVTPRKKKQINRDVAAIKVRKDAEIRRLAGQDEENRLPQIIAQNQSEGRATDIIINTITSERQDPIYINAHIGSKMKLHQIEGVRFMWRELVTLDSEDLQGCLLAHTMGLGKTMQAITILVTIAEASQSSNEKISNQIPSSLKQSRTLILCPPSLIENWDEEFRHWRPKTTVNVGRVIKHSSTIKQEARLASLRDWYDGGGVLIMGYHVFRAYITNPARQRKGGSEYRMWVETEHKEIEKYLLSGPNIVVADEAPEFKNENSIIGSVVGRFRTRSRIAMTGSPLANHLGEYFQLIDWIAPGYLGSAEEFRHVYRIPIEQANYADTRPAERREGFKRLEAFNLETSAKVHRRGIECLQNQLKPKIEFVITIEASDIQKEAYNTLVKRLLATVDSHGPTNNARLFAWLHLLTLLLDHPSRFFNKLNSKQASTDQHTQRKQLDQDNGEIPEDVKLADAGLSREAIIDQERVFADYYGSTFYLDPVLSSKMTIINHIVAECKRIGDKVLIFSHYIPTLDYLEEMLMANNVPFSRIDGSTKTDERASKVKDFQRGVELALLISTKAGGVGLNIIGANRVILVDFAFNPQWEQQAVGRAYRIGQEKPVYVYHFVTGGTFEEKVKDKTNFKQQLASQVVDKKRVQSVAMKTKELLFAIKDVPRATDMQSHMGKDMVLDRILKSQLGQQIVRAINTMEVLQRDSGERLTEEEQREVDTWRQVRRSTRLQAQQHETRTFQSTQQQPPQPSQQMHWPRGS